MKNSNSNLVINLAITGTAIAAGLMVAWGVSGADRATVQGTVQLDGQAVPWADVVFVSEDSSVEPIAVKANQNGQYEVTGDLPAGSYLVMTRGTASIKDENVGDRADELDEYQRQMFLTSKQKAAKPSTSIPASYGDVNSTPLRTEIVEGTSIDFDLHLQSENKQLADRKSNQSTTVR